MELTLNNYIPEIDEEIQRQIDRFDIQSIDNLWQLIISPITLKYEKLPDKLRRSIYDYIIDKFIPIFKKEFCLKNENNNQILQLFIHNNFSHINPRAIVNLNATVLTLMEDVEKLKKHMDNLMEYNKSLREELDNQKTINEGIHSKLETFKKVGSDPTDNVNTIQRYWRRYVILRNVKRLAREYEEQLLIEFRKNVMFSSGLPRNPLLGTVENDIPLNPMFEAARKRMNPLPKKLKASSSDPKNWTDRKAEQVSRDWLS